MYALIDGEGNILLRDSDRRTCEIEKETLETYSGMQYLDIVELEEDND